MRKRVLLISANTCLNPDPVFPLGIAQLDAALRAAGHDTRWFDALTPGGELEHALAGFDPDCIGISLRNIDDVLINHREVYFGAVAGLCRRIRAVSARPIVLGGSGFSIFPAELLRTTAADYGIHGEGERGLLALLDAIDEPSTLPTVPGLVWKEGNAIRVNPQHMAGEPAPLHPASWPPEVLSHYLRACGTLNLQTQRGCAHKCCYCTYPVVEGRRHRARPPEEVAEDMARLQGAGARYAFVVDSIFNSSAGHVTAICEALIKRGTTLQWGCFIRPRGLTAELCALMRRAGLAHAEIGSDSFCDTVLTAYRKNFSFDDILHSTEFLRASGVECCHFIIAGGPGETEGTLEEGFSNSLQLGQTVILAVVGMRIYPGTELQRRAVAEGSLAATADLLQPTYYLAPGLDKDVVDTRLREFAARSGNWLAGDIPPSYRKLVSKLRSRGHVGPLWGYIPALRRLFGDAASGMGGS